MYIGVTISKNAYTPEAYAYKKYLESKGHLVQLDYVLDPQNDINIYFMGARPFWKKSNGRAKEIHEYQSLSTPPYARFKNYAKKIVNTKPSGRIFLNDLVCKELNFNKKIPFIYRDMGVDEHFFQKPSKKPLFDVVYCGSVSGRPGLIDVILKISQSYKIAIVGHVNIKEKEILGNKRNITLLGRVDRDSIAEIYFNSRYGLNYTPNIYPYNIQTSTKTLEYLASGLKVISNRYLWSNEFDKKYNSNFIWIDDEGSFNEDESKVASNEIFKEFLWENVLDRSGIELFLGNILNDF